jgi:hypothetical protein
MHPWADGSSPDDASSAGRFNFAPGRMGWVELLSDPVRNGFGWTALQQAGPSEVAFHPFVPADLEHVHGFPPIHLSKSQAPSLGWKAVNLTVLEEARLGFVNPHPEITLRPDTMKAPKLSTLATLLAAAVTLE